MFGKTLVWLLVIALVFVCVWAVARLQGPSRYDRMTDQEFELEAQKGPTARGQILREVQGIIEAERKMDYVQQLDKKVEGEHSEIGDGTNTRS